VNESLLPLVGIALVLFVSTNIDDLFLLVAFFADNIFRTRDTVLGPVCRDFCTVQRERCGITAFSGDPSCLHWPVRGWFLF
jgi:hypothetical protein